ncbi:MAG: hypothetical protein ABH834_03675 [Candidatus Altiarchaeota archaeon]
MDSEFQRIGEWLSLTEQQFDILTAIHKLRLGKETPSPKNIVLEYKKLSGKLIQKPNLFTIIKLLSDKNLVTKTGQGEYDVNLTGIQELLAKKKEDKQKELNQLSRIVDETENYFRKQLKPIEQPTVHYLAQHEVFGKLGERLANSTAYHIVENFPSIAYTYPVYSGLGRSQYQETLLEKTIKGKKLRLCVLTDLDVDYVFNHAFMTLGDPVKAYNECQLMLKQFRNMLELSGNIDVRFHEDPHGLDVAIPEGRLDEPVEFVIFTRDEHKNIMGGVHVKAGEPAKSAKHMFNRLFQYAEKLEGSVADKRVKEAQERLTLKYGVLEK